MAVQQNVADYINSIEVGHPINLSAYPGYFYQFRQVAG